MLTTKREEISLHSLVDVYKVASESPRNFTTPSCSFAKRLNVLPFSSALLTATAWYFYKNVIDRQGHTYYRSHNNNQLI